MMQLNIKKHPHNGVLVYIVATLLILGLFGQPAVGDESASFSPSTAVVTPPPTPSTLVFSTAHNNQGGSVGLPQPEAQENETSDQPVVGNTTSTPTPTTMVATPNATNETSAPEPTQSPAPTEPQSVRTGSLALYIGTILGIIALVLLCMAGFHKIGNMGNDKSKASSEATYEQIARLLDPENDHLHPVSRRRSRSGSGRSRSGSGRSRSGSGRSRSGSGQRSRSNSVSSNKGIEAPLLTIVATDEVANDSITQRNTRSVSPGQPGANGYPRPDTPMTMLQQASTDNTDLMLCSTTSELLMPAIPMDVKIPILHTADEDGRDLATNGRSNSNSNSGEFNKNKHIPHQQNIESLPQTKTTQGSTLSTINVPPVNATPPPGDICSTRTPSPNPATSAAETTPPLSSSASPLQRTGSSSPAGVTPDRATPPHATVVVKNNHDEHADL